MNWQQLNFEHSGYLWALLAIPAVWTLSRWRRRRGDWNRLEAFADKDLLPYLVNRDPVSSQQGRRALYRWLLAWALAILAVAGPRWDFTEVPSFRPSRDLVVALDLSQSMDAQDVAPSRLAKARQRLQDLLEENSGVNIGLVAFAADAHLVSPITEDHSAIRHLLPALRTDLIHVPGSRVAPALALAEQMLTRLPGSEKAVLVMSDGGFEDDEAFAAAASLARQGIRISTMGFGTVEGAPVPRESGGFFVEGSQPVMSKLNRKALRSLSEKGRGFFVESDDPAVVAKIRDGFFPASHGDPRTTQMTRDWEPRFYLFLFPLLLLLMPLFRRRRAVVSAALAFVLLQPAMASAGETPKAASGRESAMSRWFKNRSTRGKEAFEAGNYSGAIEKFEDPYRRGVTQYRAGNFAEAEKSFREPQRKEVRVAAEYNLGNTLAQEQKYREAIEAYRKVLEENPRHAAAEKNMKLVEDILKKQPPPPPSSASPSPKEEEAKDESKNAQVSKGGDESKNAQGSKGGDESKNAQGSKGADESKNAQGSKGADESKNAQGSKGADESKNAQGSKGADESKNAQGSKGADESKNAQGSKGSDELKSAQASKGSEASKKGEPSAAVGAAERPDGADSGKSSESGEKQQKVARTMKDIDADQWLSRIVNDPHDFLKNQFTIESLRKRTRKGSQSW